MSHFYTTPFTAPRRGIGAIMRKYHYQIGFGVEQDRHGRDISREHAAALLRAICHDAADAFGGYTLIPVTGGWVDPAGGLIEEAGYTLSLIVDGSPMGGPVPHAVREFAEHVGCVLDQHSVVLIHPDGEAEFVEVSYPAD